VQVTVEPDALAEWSAHARRTGERLDARLGALDGGLAPLARAWGGAAADEFLARHRQWRVAAAGLLDTLAALTELVETAHANYLAAAAANARIWHADAARATVVLHAMHAGRARISVDVEVVRDAVGQLVAALDGLGTAWVTLAGDLAGTATMAGGDDVGAAFAVDYNAMADAAWQGWRSSVLLLDGIAAGLAETGNNLVKAEIDSTPSRRWMFPPIVVATGPLPSPAAPAVVAGGPASGPLTGYWPTADVALLRGAARAWRDAADDVAFFTRRRAVDAVEVLVAAGSDPVLQQVRRFTDEALSDDPTSGLVGVLKDTGMRIASACSGLADETERTRERILATVAHYTGGDEWYHPVADVLDRYLRFRPAGAIAAAGDAYLLDLDLSAIHDDHVRAVESVRGELHPAAADRLARIATAVVPPRPITPDTCAVTSPPGPAGAAVPEAQRAALIAEVVAAGNKISPDAVVHVARAPDGRVVWLERGDGRTGLSHLLRAERIADFVAVGVAPADVPGLAVRAILEGVPTGRSGRDGTVYDVDIGGGRHRDVVVVVGSNGYIVTAYPVGSDDGGEGP
jgi:WXG100 family type VII secretion target